MAQRLILPIEQAAITAGYKNKKYLEQFGFTHYGVDMVATDRVTSVVASGYGEVIATGLDGVKGPSSGMGYIIVIKYKSVITPQGVKDLIATYCHLQQQIFVKPGEIINKYTKLGKYGNTGGTTTGAHLHLQFDYDTINPLYMTGISSQGHAILHKGTKDTTVNPFDILHIGENQKAHTKYSGWAENYKQLKNEKTYSKEELLEDISKLIDRYKEVL